MAESSRRRRLSLPLDAKMNYKANRIEIDREYAVVVAFADEAEEGEYNEIIIFQRSLPEDDDGAGICTIKGNQEFVAYGGITSFSINKNKCICHFSESASKELGGCEEIQINFENQESKSAELKSALNYIFDGHPNFRESI